MVLVLVALWVLISMFEECDDGTSSTTTGVRTGTGIFIGGK